jgi:serine/threonine protein phosphatase PrpC
MKYRVRVKCDQGLVRENMEDAAYPDCGFEGILESPHAVAVADGLGGHPAGEVASAITVSHVKEIVDEKTFKEAMQKACKEVGEAHPGCATTLTLAVLGDDYVDVYWIGDSPAILIDKEDKPSFISTPHAEPYTGRITSVIGGRKPCDFFYDKVRVPLDKIKAVILATDGLTAHLSLKDIGQKYLEGADLVQEALDRGGSDNVTVIVIEPVEE